MNVLPVVCVIMAVRTEREVTGASVIKDIGSNLTANVWVSKGLSCLIEVEISWISV